MKKLTSTLKLSGFVDISEVHKHRHTAELNFVLQVEVTEDADVRTGLQTNGVTLKDEDKILLAFVSTVRPILLVNGVIKYILICSAGES